MLRILPIFTTSLRFILENNRTLISLINTNSIQFVILNAVQWNEESYFQFTRDSSYRQNDI
jgi:tryptophanase